MSAATTGSQAAVDAGARALWAHRNRNAREPSSPAPDHIDRMMATVVLGAALPHLAAPVTRGQLTAALQHPAVTGALAMLDSQGGTPVDLADAILEALWEAQPETLLNGATAAGGTREDRWRDATT